MTQLELARSGKISEEVKEIAKRESVEPEALRKAICLGRVVVPKNKRRAFSGLRGIGEGLSTKVNANIGTSKDSSDITTELNKMNIAIELGADAVMDLSTGDRVKETRQKILAKSSVPVGTVPIYEMAINVFQAGLAIKDISMDGIISVLEAQAAEGVDFFTIHAGITRRTIKLVKHGSRVLGIVSRGGAFLAEWMVANNKENPFYENFDEVLRIAREYDVTLSLGDGLRPGSVADATDSAQIDELMTLGELQRRAVEKGVQVMIEGPGHVPINQIEANVLLEKRLCNGAPFYVLGPLVTDVAPGYDHITAAIGGALAAAKGADFLCYVTPSEHLRLPTVEDVAEGVIACRIAAHAADIAKGVKGAIDWDIKISKARQARDWNAQFELAIDKSKPKKYRDLSTPGSQDVCTMCSEYCSIKVSEKCLKGVE